MDTKLLLRLCSLLCLLCLSVANSDQKNGQKQSVDDILQDMKMASSEPEEEEHEGKGLFNKEIKGGFDKGAKKYSMDDWLKKGNDYGKKKMKEYDAKDKYGMNKYDKKDMNNFGEKWADKNGKEKKNKFEEWGQDQKWKTDKGKGYEKAYEYDKSEGKKMSYGKKAKDMKVKYEDKHGDKHAMNKKEMKGKDNFAKKMNQGKEKQMDWGKMYKSNGKMNKGMNHYESKHPSKKKMSKWEKKKKEKKEKKPSGDEPYEEAEAEDDGQDDGGAEEGGAYDEGGHAVPAAEQLANQYGGELMDGQPLLVPQGGAYDDLEGHGYTMDDAAAGQLAGALGDYF